MTDKSAAEREARRRASYLILQARLTRDPVLSKALRVRAARIVTATLTER